MRQRPLALEGYDNNSLALGRTRHSHRLPHSADSTIALAELSPSTRVALTKLDTDGDGTVSPGEVKGFIARTGLLTRRLWGVIAAGVLVLLVSYVCVGGILFWVVQRTKEVTASPTSTSGLSNLLSASGARMHVASSQVYTTSVGMSTASDDSFFDALVTIKLGGGAGATSSLTLQLDAWARADADTVLFFPSATAFFPLLQLQGTTLSVVSDPALVAAALAALAASTHGALPTKRELLEGSAQRRAQAVAFAAVSVLCEGACCQGYAANARGGCSLCAAGTFSAAGASSCSPCAAGYSFAGAGACALSTCPAGAYVAASAACARCMPGFFSATSGAAACTACDSSTLGSIGATSCPCPAGAYGVDQGADTTCSSCAAGEFAPAGASSCSSCSPGYSFAGASACALACPAGAYVAASAACALCAPGFFSEAEGAPSCSPCASGAFSFTGSSVCSLPECPAGSYLSAPPSGCSSCPSGTFSNAANAIACTQCQSAHTLEGATSCPFM